MLAPEQCEHERPPSFETKIMSCKSCWNLHKFCFSFQVKIGLSLPVSSTVRELREQLSSDTGIPESCMLLTQIDDLGFQRTFSGLSSISEIKETDPVYCIEMPQLKDATEDVEKYILLCWVNVLTMDDHCSR